MASVPSIKGSVYASIQESVNKLLTDGSLTREDAQRWLDDSDFELLDISINVASWYDIRSYDRMNRLLCDVEGGGDPAYLRAMGKRTAQRLIEMGLYSQMEYLRRTEVGASSGTEERFAAFGRDLRRINTLSASILNFTTWAARPDPDAPRRYRIEVSEASAMPETLVWRTDGFVNEMARNHSSSDLWNWKREGPDRIIYRMNREV